LLRFKFKYSSETVENMLPWELMVELDMIHADLAKENENG
jgi:hypothetical protein